MNEPLPKKVETGIDSEEQALPASYTRFLDRWPEVAGGPSARPTQPEATGSKEAPGDAAKPDTARKRRRRARPPRTATGSRASGPFVAPRRRASTESIKVRLAPEQLYWLRLTAARAGRKVNESMIVAAGLRVIEWLNLDWRCIDSRTAIAAALAEALSPEGPERSAADLEGEWGKLEASVRREAATPPPPPPPAASEPHPEPGATEA